MPDIDVDFCCERREEVIDYVVKKYGAERVCQICTFGTMKAKQAVRDVGRAMNMPYGQVDAIAKKIPFDLKMTLDRALEASPELRKDYDEDKFAGCWIPQGRLRGCPDTFPPMRQAW